MKEKRLSLFSCHPPGGVDEEGEDGECAGDETDNGPASHPVARELQLALREEHFATGCTAVGYYLGT